MAFPNILLTTYQQIDIPITLKFLLGIFTCLLHYLPKNPALLAQNWGEKSCKNPFQAI